MSDRSWHDEHPTSGSADAQLTRVQLLGPVRLFPPGARHPLPVPRGRASQLLAILLANQRRVVSVEAIIDGLWPRNPPLAVRQIVASLVSRLRRVLEPGRIQRLGEGFRLDTSGWLVDVDEVVSLLASAEANTAAGEPVLDDASARRALAILASGQALSPRWATVSPPCRSENESRYRSRSAAGSASTARTG